MKKRLLSAALALAMVLTLLPVSAFAATTTNNGTSTISGTYTTGTAPNTVTHPFYDVSGNNNITQTVSIYLGQGESYGREYGSWYWLDNKTDPQNPVYKKVTSGIIAGNNGSGNWYNSLTDFTTTSGTTTSLRSTSFTVLNMAADVGTLSLTAATLTLNVDLVGSSASLTVPSNITSLTVTSKYETSPVGTVTVPVIDHSGYAATAPDNSAVTINATNVKVGTISLTGRGNSVTLTNCEATSVTMDGQTDTTNDGVVNKNTHSAQRFTATNTKITGNIDIKGDGSTVSLTSVNGGTSATPAGSVTVKGHGGSLLIAGASNVGDVVVNSRAAATTDTTIANIPTVTVTGGTVKSIKTTGEAGPNASSFTLNNNTGKTTVSGAIETEKGSVSVGANVTTAAITVKDGSLTLAGPLSTGLLTLGNKGVTTLSISGNGSDIAGITLDSAVPGNLVIRSWPTGRNNDFGTVNLANYAGKGITGGTLNGAQAFNTAAKMLWVNTTTTNLLYQVNVGTKTALYNKDELGKAIEDIGQANASAATPNIGIIGQGLTNVITLKYGSETLATIGHTDATPIILPNRLNSKNIVSWMLVGASDSVVNSYVSGREYTLPARALELNATNVSEDVAKITGVVAKLAGSDAAIRAELNGTTINLSGAVSAGTADVTTIELDLTTDVIDTAGNPVKLVKVPVDFNNTTKATQFNEFWVPSGGARIENGQLILANGTRYTVSGSGLAVPALSLTVAGPTVTTGYEIKVSVGGRMSSWRQESKDELIEKLGGAGAEFTITNNAAMAEAINAAQATITNDTTVTNWVKTAQTNIWRSGFKSPNSTNNTAPGGYAVSGGQSLTPHGGNISSTDATGGAIMSAFSKAYLVPYLQVNVTDYDESGLLTATLVPSYRIDVSGATYDPDMAYTVQAGRALSNLTGDMATNPVKVKFGTALEAAFGEKYMHQDGKYVYKGTTGKEWTINHAGTTGLGTIQINAIDGLIELTNGQAGAKIASGKYDSLQAAVDDTIPETTAATSEIVIKGGFDGSCAFTMTGAARTIQVQALGNKEVSCASNYVTATQIDGENYTFQLMRDTAVVTGNVDIAVNTATNGSAAASVSKTAAGQVVTITAYPATGYVVGTMTAVTNTNANVPVSNAGNNQYTFTVPANTTKVTVTPTFVVGDTTATFVVNSNPNQGTAQAITGTTDGKAQQGTTVPVTVIPNSSYYRTIGLTARGNNNASATVTRTGTNTFNVTVPAGATTVTLSPSFDVNTGTPFTDVLSSHWASSYVTWAYQNKYIEGTGSYTYSPSAYMTRGEVVAMLYKAAGSPSVAGLSNPFTDVTPTSHWAYNAFIWAYHQGLISGGTINPFGYATRAEIVQILYKRAGSPSVYGTSGFADVASNASYSRAVTWARQKGLTNGYSGNTYFRPGYAVSRAEMAAFLQRAFSK